MADQLVPEDEYVGRQPPPYRPVDARSEHYSPAAYADLLVAEDPGSARQPSPPKPADPGAGRISIADKRALQDTTLSDDAVLAKIVNAYVPGIKRCYRDTLKKTPSARGRMTLAITVSDTGRTIKGTATTFDDSLASCVQGQMSSWRFPLAKNASGEATQASFEIVIQLVPE